MKCQRNIIFMDHVISYFQELSSISFVSLVFHGWHAAAVLAHKCRSILVRFEGRTLRGFFHAWQFFVRDVLDRRRALEPAIRALSRQSCLRPLWVTWRNFLTRQNTLHKCLAQLTQWQCQDAMTRWKHQCHVLHVLETQMVARYHAMLQAHHWRDWRTTFERQSRQRHKQNQVQYIQSCLEAQLTLRLCVQALIERWQHVLPFKAFHV
jgi:hypothetical protein